MLRAVLDTNVVLAADRASNPLSPNKEILSRWANREFTWLVTSDIAAEYAEKLLEKGNAPEEVEAFITGLLLVADFVDIRFFHFRHYPVDSDDTIFLLCAINGAATHLVSYDHHLLDIGIFYDEFLTCRPVEFLANF
ncbi:PIN domain-containing protein [Haloferula sp.]|uniref:PIN domain-containing protein n=1 Tax=Haloferula sp. TaxID=2497595 RepID=UPI003C70B485